MCQVLVIVASYCTETVTVLEGASLMGRGCRLHPS